MRLRAGLLMVLTVIGLAVLVPPASPAWACSCAWGPAEQARNAEVIVVGRVAEVADNFIRLEVESVEKGRVDRTAPLKLKVGRNEASCGYHFGTGMRYRVNARDGATGLCTGVAELPPLPAAPTTASPAAAVPVAAPGVPESDRRPGWPIAAGVVLMVVAGLAVWRRRTR